jgi:hypothetical protein
MLPIATTTDLGGIRLGTGLHGAPDGTVSSIDRFSLYFNDYIFGLSATWVATGSCSISAGVNPGIAMLEVGPKQPITFDIYYLDNRTAYSESPPKVGVISFPAGNGAVTGIITFSQAVAMEAGNVLGIQKPKPTDAQAKGCRLVIAAS